MATLDQLFAQNGLVRWWDPKYLTQAFNGRNELGRDFGLPLSTPIASISAGRVIYSQQMNSNPGSSVGYIVQVQNADGSLFHYQHLRAPAVHVGDYVRAGQIVGYSGGCPAAGYGANRCTFTDKYSTGPHIEVRYSPTYSKAAGAWGQHWVNPVNAFAAYGGQNLANLAPGSADILALLNGFAAGFAGASGGPLAPISQLSGASGISGAINDTITRVTGTVEDAGVRAFLLVGGFVLAGVGLFMLGMETVKEAPPIKRIRGAAGEIGGAAIAGEAGAQAAKAIVPPVGDKRRQQQLARPMVTRVTEEPRKAPQASALPSPTPAAIKAPTAPPALPAGNAEEPGVDDQLAAIVGFKSGSEAAKVARDNPDDPRIKQLKKIVADAADVKGARGPQPSPGDITIKAIAPPDLGPLLPKDAQAGAAKRQQKNKTREQTRREEARQRRNARRRKQP